MRAQLVAFLIGNCLYNDVTLGQYTRRIPAAARYCLHVTVFSPPWRKNPTLGPPSLRSSAALAGHPSGAQRRAPGCADRRLAGGERRRHRRPTSGRDGGLGCRIGSGSGLAILPPASPPWAGRCWGGLAQHSGRGGRRTVFSDISARASPCSRAASGATLLSRSAPRRFVPRPPLDDGNYTRVHRPASSPLFGLIWIQI